MSAESLPLLWAVAGPWLDPSLVAAPFIVRGYRLGRRHVPRAWLYMACANALLVLTGLLSIFVLPHGIGTHHVGLLVAAWLIYESRSGFVAWRREASPARVAGAKA